MAREIRLIKALADEGYQFERNDGRPPIPRDRWVAFASLPRALARRFRDEIERGGIPVLMLRGDGRVGADGMRDYELLVPATVEALVVERHAADRDRYRREADAVEGGTGSTGGAGGTDAGPGGGAGPAGTDADPGAGAGPGGTGAGPIPRG
jgi:hypothetical protein